MKARRAIVWFIVVAGGWMTLAATQAATPIPDDLALKLSQACDAGDLNQVKALLAEGASIENGAGPYQITPLISAEKHVAITIYLLAQGAKVDATDSQGNTALLYAAFGGQQDTVKALLEAGANVEATNSGGRRPLMSAAKTGQTEIVKMLLAHHADINSDNNDGTPLWFALEQDHADTLQVLIQAGADLHALPTPPLLNHGLSLLGEAARKGFVDEIDLLLNHGVSVNSAGEDGTTALMQAVYWKKSAAAAKLIARGAQVNLRDQQGRTALNLEMSHFDEMTFAALLNAHPDVNLADNHGVTPLMLSVHYNQEDTWEKLLKDGAQLEAKDEQGCTPLITACIHFYDPAIHFLVAHGANVNATDIRGETALTYAGDRGRTDAVQFLKDHHALRTDVHIIQKEKPSPPLAPERAWVLAVGATYAQNNGGNPNILGYGMEQDRERKGLRTSWGVRDRPSFLREEERLFEIGQRRRMRVSGAALAQVPDWLFIISFMGMHKKEAMLRGDFQKWGDKIGLAWDLCRYVNLINSGYAAGYISDTEAWSLLAPVVDQLRGNFSSWHEMNDNFLDGRDNWAESWDPSFDACSKLLLDPKEPNSPWNENPWASTK